MRSSLCQLLCPLLLALVGGCAGLVLDTTAYYPRTCGVHGTSLRPAIVRSVNGLPLVLIVPEWREAQRTQFPYANTKSFGGCTGGGPPLTRLMYCRDCRRAERVWVRDELPRVRREYATADATTESVFVTQQEDPAVGGR